MASNSGTKVTKGTQAVENLKNENPGVVTSDSLAAESIDEGGSFGANSDARGPSAQPSKSTTTNITDVTNATRLDSAPNAKARLASQGSEDYSSNTGGQSGSTSGVGPTYAAMAGGAFAQFQGNQIRPKGQNLQEGDFDSDAPNASFNTDIGGKDDPGRAALRQMEQDNVPVAGDTGPRQGKVSNDGQFDSLDETYA